MEYISVLLEKPRKRKTNKTTNVSKNTFMIYEERGENRK